MGKAPMSEDEAIQMILTPKSVRPYEGVQNENSPASENPNGGSKPQTSELQVSKHTINSYNQSNGSNFYSNTTGMNFQHKNSKLQSATTADSTNNSSS